MKYVIEAGDYSFDFYIASGKLNHLHSGLMLFNYDIEIFRDGSYIYPQKHNLYKDLGITKDEFKTLLVEGTKKVIEEDLYFETYNNRQLTQICSFVFFAEKVKYNPNENKYGFSQHDIFKEISDDYLRLHSQGYNGEKTYVHVRELFLRSYYDSIGNKHYTFDFHADTALIETICDKIKANQETDE